MKFKVPAMLLCLLILTSCSSQSATPKTDPTEPYSGITEQNAEADYRKETTENLTEETIADNDYAAIARKLTFFLLDDDNSVGTKELCDSYFEEYIKTLDTKCEYINIGRCDSMNADDEAPQIKKHLTGGYVYCIDRSWEENWCYYVNPDKKAVYSCMVDSDMALCWKDGLAFDEKAAAEFAKNILGESAYEAADGFSDDLDGYYSLYYISDNSYIYISWDLTQIFYEKVSPDASYEDYHQEMHLIYPKDTIGYFS